MNAKISCLLFVLKQSFTCYYIFSMTVPLIKAKRKQKTYQIQ